MWNFINHKNKIRREHSNQAEEKDLHTHKTTINIRLPTLSRKRFVHLSVALMLFFCLSFIRQNYELKLNFQIKDSHHSEKPDKWSIIATKRIKILHNSAI